jgi:hypothetical protein
MINHPNIHMRWGNSAEKRHWMRSLAMLLKVMEDSAILKTDRSARATSSCGSGSSRSSSTSA